MVARVSPADEPLARTAMEVAAQAGIRSIRTADIQAMDIDRRAEEAAGELTTTHMARAVPEPGATRTTRGALVADCLAS
jgi:hypothetical protein